MSAPLQLIIGLANPGKEYAATRHNAGAWFIEHLAKDQGVSLRYQAKYHGLHAELLLDGQIRHLLIPTTFMNLSGQAVKACMNYYKIPESAILVVHDDIDLPPGSIKLKTDGGDGGHNGLKDIIRHLNTKAFNRLRIGVGRPSSGKADPDYVLSAPSKADKASILLAIDKAYAVFDTILAGDIQKAMLQLHTTE